MTPITLETIQAEQARMSSLIADYERQQATKTYCFPNVVIALAPGEQYAGIVLNDAGMPSHHLILLPGEEPELSYGDALAWAKGVGGDLPGRHEQALLFANLRGFRDRAYWSAETWADEDFGAWYQNFKTGTQDYGIRQALLRAVAVRRVTI